MEREPVEPASTTYKDWVGTAAAENSMIASSGDLHKLAGLDAERWTVVAIDMWAHSHGEPPNWTVIVHAFDREANAAEDFEGMRRLLDERGSVPVTSVQVHNASLEDVVKCMKVVHFQLRNPHLSGLDVVQRTDHPPQE